MKSLSIKKIIVSGIFLSSLFPFLSDHLLFAEPENTRITNVQGNAVILRGGQSIPAKAGAECETNDVFKTEAGGVVDVSINNLAGCRVLPSSESSIVNTKEGEMKVKINSGGIILNVEKLAKAAKFQVETPTAIATVRGTQFSGFVDASRPGNPVCTFAVRENAVDVMVFSTGETITVGEGRALDIPRDISGPLSARQAFGREMSSLEQTSTIKTCS